MFIPTDHRLTRMPSPPQQLQRRSPKSPQRKPHGRDHSDDDEAHHDLRDLIQLEPPQGAPVTTGVTVVAHTVRGGELNATLDQSQSLLSNTLPPELTLLRAEPPKGEKPKEVVAIIEAIRAKQQKELEDKLKRTAGGPNADDRKCFRQNIREAERLKKWFEVLVVVQAAALMHGVRVANRSSVTMLQRFPICCRALLKCLRRAKCRVMQRELVARPTAEELCRDQLLRLFSDEHLSFVAATMTPRVFLPNEAVIYCKSEETTCYFIQEGFVEVRVGSNTVATLSQGTVCGAMGMLTGEPRTATLIAKRAVLAWELTQENFNTFTVNDHKASKAHELIRDQRQANLRKAYAERLEPKFLRRMFGLRQWPDEVITRMVNKGTPFVFKQGETLLKDYASQGQEEGLPCSLTDTAPLKPLELQEEAAVYIMNGRIRFLLRGDCDAPPPGKCLEEHLSFVCGLCRPRRPGDFIDVMTRCANTFSRSGGARVEDAAGSIWTIVAEVAGPLVLNMAPLIVNDASPFRVETATMCDALIFHPKEALRHIDSIETIRNVRRECHELSARFVEIPSQKALRSLIIPRQMCFSFLFNFPFERLPWIPTAIDRGEVIKIEPNDSAECFIILSGEMSEMRTASAHHLVHSSSESVNSLTLTNSEDFAPKEYVAAHGGGHRTATTTSMMSLWPDLPRIFFGSGATLTAVAPDSMNEEKVLLLRCKRQHFIEAISATLSLGELKTFVDALSSTYKGSYGAAPEYRCVRSAVADGRVGSCISGKRLGSSNANDLSAAIVDVLPIKRMSSGGDDLQHQRRSSCSLTDIAMPESPRTNSRGSPACGTPRSPGSKGFNPSPRNNDISIVSPASVSITQLSAASMSPSSPQFPRPSSARPSPSRSPTTISPSSASNFVTKLRGLPGKNKR